MVPEQEKRNPYEVLGLCTTADPTEIKAAYRRLVKRFHPDKHLKRPKWARAKMIELVSAYKSLQNTRTRLMAQRQAERSGKMAARRARRAPDNGAQRILHHLQSLVDILLRIGIRQP